MSTVTDQRKFATAKTIPDDQYVAIREAKQNRFKPWQASESLYGQPRHPYVTAVFFVEEHAAVSRAWVAADLFAAYRRPA